MERLDKVVLARMPDFSRSRIEGLIKAGYVTVNGVAADKAGMKVSEADDIVITVPPPVPAVPVPEEIPLLVVYEDDDIVVVDKPPGLVVHPAPGHYSGTLVNALLAHCPTIGSIGGVARPGIVHRLDQDTSGLIVAAKSEPAMLCLAKAFASHDLVEKTYVALCHGRPRLDAGRIENMIGRHPVNRKKMALVDRDGKVAITNWQVAPGTVRARYPGVTAVVCRIAPGRTHPIRVHMASLGCPVVGDAIYGKGALDRTLDPVPPRQMLHAWRLSLWHPVKGEKMSFEAPIPADMAVYMADAPLQPRIDKQTGGNRP